MNSKIRVSIEKRLREAIKTMTYDKIEEIMKKTPALAFHKQVTKRLNDLYKEQHKKMSPKKGKRERDASSKDLDMI